ncbi:hypothetical protein PCE1_000898 [Barthelona sp. PCE]
MIKVFANEGGKATIIRQNESDGLEPITIAIEEYLNLFWVSKNEKVLATVHTNPSNSGSSIIKLFSVPSLSLLNSIDVEGEVKHGCLSFDGQVVAYKVNDQYNVNDVEGNSISSFSFPAGTKCWADAQCLIIKDNSGHIRLKHGSSASNRVFGEFVLHDPLFLVKEATTYTTIDRYSCRTVQKNFHDLIEQGSTAEERYPNLNRSTMLLGDISANYMVLANNSVVQLFNRNTKQGCGSFNVEGEKQSIYISHDEKYFSVNMECGDSQIFSILSQKHITTIANNCFGYSTTIKILEEDLFRLDTPLGSYIKYQKFVIPCDRQCFVAKVSSGYLLFFATKVTHVTKTNSVTKEYESHSGVVVGFEKESESVFNVVFESGKILLLEWNNDTGFGRTMMCNDESRFNIIDANLKINDLRSKLAEQKIFFQEKLTAQEKKTQAKFSEMDVKFQVTFDTLSQLVPNSGNKEFGELIAYSKKCAEVIQQLYVPSQSFLDWISSDPTVQTMEKHLDELEMAISYVRDFRNIIVAFEINETLASTFSSRFDKLVSRFPIAKVLNERAFAEKLRELTSFDFSFELFHLLSDQDLKNSHVVMNLFIDKLNTLTRSSKQIKGIAKDLEESREEQELDSLDHPVNFDRLYTLQQRMERHASEISEAECVNFEKAKGYMTRLVTQNIKTLKKTICELALAVDLSKTIEELDLKAIRFPSIPKIISYDSYLNGGLQDFGLGNGTLNTDDLFIKCICVSKRMKRGLDDNIKAIRRELRVLTKLDPCTVTLKNVVFVPKMSRGTATMMFVCIELERAPFDLEKYLESFPDVNQETKNSLAHQLVMCIFSIHAKGITLRDIKPQNILVYCNKDGTNPKLKLCDFGVSIDNSQTIGGNTMVGTFGYMAQEVMMGQPHTLLSDIYALGKTVAYIYAQDRTNVAQLVLPEDCMHSEIIQRCQAQDPQLRPSIYELNCHEWHTNVPAAQDRLTLIRRQINQFIVTKQALLRDNDREGSTMKFEQVEQTFDEFFVTVFSDINSFMSGTEYFDASITLYGMEQLSIPQFIDYIFEHHSLPQINTETSDDALIAMCGFLYCCFVFQSPIDDLQVGQFLINALSEDHDKLSDRKVFGKVFPTESAYILNMLNQEGLNFNSLLGDDRLVTADNIDEFLQFARESASEPWVELSKKVNAVFNAHELTAQLGVTLTFSEVKSMMCGPPRFTTEQVLATFKYDDKVPNNVRDALEEVLQGFNSMDILQFVYWLNGSPELHSFTVILQPDDTMLPTVALCDHSLRLPNNILRIREGLPLAIRGILPKEFKLLITQRLSQWTQDDVDDLNNRLQNAPRKTIDFNRIDGVPSVRVCPNCLTPVEHRSGCKSMKCPTCSRSFCFVCLSARCDHHGSCHVHEIQRVTLRQVKERMNEFQ